MENQMAEQRGLEKVLHEVAELLPTQGPIDVFIHHNTLHGFEHLPFEDAVEAAARVYGAQAFLSEQRYLDEYRIGRISDNDLQAILQFEVQEDGTLWGYSVPDLLKRFLTVAPPVESFQQVKWLLRESKDLVTEQHVAADVLNAWLVTHGEGDRSDGLHRINHQAAEGLEALLQEIPRGAAVVRSERTILWSAVLLATANAWKCAGETREPSNFAICEEMINPVMIRFSEEYLDLGFSNQLMPGREKGMREAFLSLVESAHFALPNWLEPLRHDLQLYRRSELSSIELMQELLNHFQVPEEGAKDFLLREALSLRGWAGYVALVEHKPELLHAQEQEIRPHLVDFLTVRLILKKYAERSAIYRSKVDDLPVTSPELEVLDEVYCFACHVLALVSSLNLGASFLVDTGNVSTLLKVLLPFNQGRRRRLWHLAYENNFYVRTLDALSHHRVARISDRKAEAQFVFCIDDREESIRRHLEMQNDCYRTYGTAGFFGVDANYTLMSGTSAPYCPVIIKPTHAIREVPRQGEEGRLSRYRRKQEAWFRVSGYVNRGSGSILHSLLLSLAGCVSLVPMILGVIAPRGLQLLTRLFGSEPMIPHDLNSLEIGIDAEGDSVLPGYTREEMAERVASVLRGIGLVSDFAKLVLLVGHGSSSRNNPLRSAYDCGACGGRPGRINARAFSLMANKPEVRELVIERFGIEIPETTHFIGAFHNTCSDQIEYYDGDRVPPRLAGLLGRVKEDLDVATRQNAFERCRRFVQSRIKNIDQAADEALSRSYMLAEARPEYGHATNAMCIVGPRSLTTGLFLDRRSFLVSYDSSIDSDSNILLGTLRAVVPVCGGINLEYLFSAMDNEVYGAGTKLPHNIVSLVGIMNGTSSDLRTGLPSQMVEIHEPVRLLLVVVAGREQLERVISVDENIRKFFAGGWIKLVLWNPETRDLEWRLPDGSYRTFQPSAEPLAQVQHYQEWFMGRSNHLGFAELAE